MNRNYLLPFLFLCLIGIVGAAQNKGQVRIDSLIGELQHAKHDTVRVNILTLISYNYASINPPEGIKYGIQAVKEARKGALKKALTKACISLGLNYMYISDFENAQKYYDEALRLGIETGDKSAQATVYNFTGVMHDFRSEYEKAQHHYQIALNLYIGLKDKRNVAGVLANLGISYMCVSDNGRALFYLRKAQEQYQGLGDTNALAGVYINLGILFYNLADYPKALENYFQALKIQEALSDERGISITTGNIAIVYMELKDYARAMEYNLKSLKTSKKIGDKYGVAGRLNDIGEIFRIKGDYQSALKYYQEALEINRETDNKNYTSINLINIGQVYRLQAEYIRALECCSEALAISKEIGSLSNISLCYLGYSEALLALGKDSTGDQPDRLFGGNKTRVLQRAKLYADSAASALSATGELKLLKDAYRLRSESQQLLGEYRQALEDYQMYILLKDSIFNTDTERKIAKLEARRTEELNQKQLEIKDLQIAKSRNERWYFVVGLLLLLTLSAVLFNRYRLKKKANIIITREKKRSDDLLLNILPSEVAEELKNKGFADARHFDEVTVLFTDFKDFSRISERLTPAELVSEIDVCFKAFDTIMGKYGIEKIKTIGDSYMAAGGLPIPNKTNPSDMIKAALEIQKFMQEHALNNKAQHKEVFEIRVGIHTGPVVAGIVGIKKFAYDIWGDTVNIASRMESSGETGRVNISGSTYALVKNDFRFQHRGKIEAKNKGMIDMYFVEGEIDTAVV